MPTWPRNYTDSESVYSNNERYKAGRYPVGESGFWHSGIHINYMSGSDTKVYPVLGGHLVAYHIPAEYQKIKRLPVITPNEFEKLTGEEQQLYVRSVSFPVTLYSLKEDINQNDAPEQHANGFMLFKHSVTLPGNNNSTEKLDFFILYTNLMPDCTDTNDFQDLHLAPKQVPFYKEYLFRVNGDACPERKYRTVDGVKLFADSYCTYRNKNDSAYYCNFDNFDNAGKFMEVPKSAILFDRWTGHYGPRVTEDPILVYEEAMTKEEAADEKKRKERELTTLKETAIFYHGYYNEPYDGYFKVYVDPPEVTETAKITRGGMPAIVKKSDLEELNRGYISTAGNFLTEEQSGLLVYDKKSGKDSRANGRDILFNNDTVEVLEPKKLLENLYEDIQYIPLKPERGKTRERYVLYTKREPTQIRFKVVPDTVYSEAEVLKNQPYIKPGELLGYGGQPPRYNYPHVDIALFFNDVAFMKKTYRDMEQYVFPPGTALYRRVDEEAGYNPVFTQHYTTDTLQILKNTGTMLKTRSNVEYREFLYKDGIVYLPETEAAKYKRNMLDWKQFFRVLDKETTGEQDVIKALDFIKGNYSWGTDRNNVGSVLGDSCDNWHNEKRETSQAKSIKRSIVCGHPFEWDKDLYVENGKVKQHIKGAFGVENSPNRLERFKEYVAAIDIWSKLKGKTINGLNTNKNMFWYAHPAYFINHLEMVGVLLINPYYGETFGKGATLVKVVDNPGFAPKGTRYEYNGIKLMEPNEKTLFNEDFSNLPIYTDGKKHYHAGVDFSCQTGTEVVALINARVITIKDWGGSGFGKFILFRDMDNRKHHYIIAHLSRNADGIEEGKIVTPGTTVAYSGATGRITGAHLHVQLMNVDTRDIFDGEKVYNVDKNAYNPFDYKIKFIGD